MFLGTVPYRQNCKLARTDHNQQIHSLTLCSSSSCCNFSTEKKQTRNDDNLLFARDTNKSECFTFLSEFPVLFCQFFDFHTFVDHEKSAHS